MDSDAEQAFANVAGKPHVWQQAAREYILAANYLLDWYDVSRDTPDAADFTFTLGGIAPVMVLYATAVENLLKAIRVALEGNPATKGALPSHFTHHDLLSHAKRSHLTLSDVDSDLLVRLGDFMEAGRYPVPTAAGKSRHAWRFDYPDDVEKTWALLQRLEDALRATGCGALPAADLRIRYRPPGYLLKDVP